VGTAVLGKRTIYVATQSLGYEVDGFPQELKARQLTNGNFQCNETVEYISITSISEDGLITPIKALCLLGRYFMFNPDTMQLEEEDIVDEEVITISAQTSDIIRFEKSQYIRKLAFDCSIVDDQQSSAYQPIPGLNVNSTYQTIKTHNFATAIDTPITEDIIFYDGVFWMVEETRKKFIYTPRKKAILYLSLKQVKR